MHQFQRRRMVECLLGQAHLCEHIATTRFDELAAETFKRLARECKADAARVSDEPVKAPKPA
jgi:hypothetical protein